jgi:rod shape-determining protein MreD
MMSRIVFALLLISAVLSQATIMPELGAIGILPNVALVLLLVWCATRGTAEGLAWVFGAGLLLDLLTLDPIGTNGLALLPVAVLAGLARRRFFQSGMVVPLLLAMVSTMAQAVVLILLRSLGDQGAIPPSSVGTLVLLQALLNALLVPPLYLVAGWMNGLTPERT